MKLDSRKVLHLTDNLEMYRRPKTTQELRENECRTVFVVDDHIINVRRKRARLPTKYDDLVIKSLYNKNWKNIGGLNIG